MPRRRERSPSHSNRSVASCARSRRWWAALALALAAGPIPSPAVAQSQSAGSRPAPVDTVDAREVFEVDARVIQVRRGAEGEPTGWRLAPELELDVLEVPVAPGERREACFFSGARSLCRTVAVGEHHDLVIRFDGDDYPTRILGTPPAAVFDEAYREAHRGKVSIAVPEVYELVNVAIALTDYAREQRFLVRKDTPYYAEVLEHFAGLKEHSFVRWLDGELRNGRYAQHKMNGYAFVFDDAGEIQRSPVYNSTNFRGQGNTLLPMLDAMRSFARASGFRDFYRAHRALYREQESFIRDALDVEGMLDWLGGHFPKVEFYDHVNVVFSPLVYGSQSVTWFRTPGFSEIQPHVNFSYGWRKEGHGLAEASVTLERGATLFTELNHGFINPTGAPYADRIAAAMEDRAYWVDPEKSAANYGWPQGVFTEMMNWGLVSLWYADRAPAEDLDEMVAANGRNQVEGRGFLRAAEFHAFLVDLYRDRPEGATVAELYPEIVAWFEAQDER